jgi:hypothetical protein
MHPPHMPDTYAHYTRDGCSPLCPNAAVRCIYSTPFLCRAAYACLFAWYKLTCFYASQTPPAPACLTYTLTPMSCHHYKLKISFIKYFQLFLLVVMSTGYGYMIWGILLIRLPWIENKKNMWLIFYRYMLHSKIWFSYNLHKKIYQNKHPLTTKIWYLHRNVILQRDV